MARSQPKVGFARSVSLRRAPAEDELFVMRRFSTHAAHCRHCANPYNTWKSGRELCDKGHALARDVAKYVYSKGGRPFSVIDKRHRDEKVELEVPTECDVVHDLVRAFDEKMTLNNSKPKIIQTRHEPVRPKPKEDRYTTIDGTRAGLVEIRPYSKREERRDRDKYRDERTDRRTSTYRSKGSLYDIDEEEKRRRRQHDKDPVIIVVEPRRYRR